jgi:hypothetical protein
MFTQVQTEHAYSIARGTAQVADEQRDAAEGRGFWKSLWIFGLGREMYALFGGSAGTELAHHKEQNEDGGARSDV